MQSKNYLEILKIVQHAIFNLNENNFKETAQATVTTLFDNHFPYSFKLIISQLLCASIVSQVKNFKIYMNFLRNIEENVDKMTEFFVKFLQLNFGLQESNYFLEFIMKHNYMDPKIIEYNNNPLYFAHRHTKKGQIFYIDTIEDDFSKNYEELSKNDWELHKKLIEEGVNPNEIAKIIRDDEVEKLQEISSHANFDFNQAIRPSLYERYSITYNSWTSLADYAAFFGSIKCFKFLIMNKANITNALKYAIAGGNIEIIHLCEQDNPSFKVACETSIQYHRNNIFHYFYEKKNIEVEDIMELGKCCVLYNNYDIFSFLLENGMKINDVIFNESVKNGNIFLMKYFLKRKSNAKKYFDFCFGIKQC